MVGKLNRKVTISFNTYSQNPDGSITKNNSDFNQMANIVTGSGNPVNANGLTQWSYDATITVRKLIEIKSNYIINFDGQNYGITSIKVNDERKKQYYEIKVRKTDVKL
jgi:SPP1 family predicted phage head-tail adaptor